MRHPYPNFTEELDVLCRGTLRKNFDTLLPASKFLKYSTDKDVESNSLWAAEPTIWSIIVYSIVIPVVSTLAFAAADLVTCALLVFSGLARGVFWCRPGWMEFDAFVHLPLGSMSSNITVLAAVCVTVDRLMVVCSLPRCKPPKFCDQRVARKLMICATCFACLANLPYWFIYTYNERGVLVTTKFFHSRLYNLQNWLQFAMFGLIPAGFLLVANGIMCHSVRKTLKERQQLLKRKKVGEGNRLQDQARLTIMLVGIVFVFLVGEVPTHLASRRSAVSLLYGGDPGRVQEVFMERFRMYATLLNAIASSANFVLYCLLCPRFLLHLKHLLSGDLLAKNYDRRKKPVCPHLQTETNDTTKRDIFVV
ncbi:hypothetical protein KM043_017734 [Ampulex compressa]|nr:hypothetical protein KM043_017734 [Ampulex compressa]